MKYWLIAYADEHEMAIDVMGSDVLAGATAVSGAAEGMKRNRDLPRGERKYEYIRRSMPRRA